MNLENFEYVGVVRENQGEYDFIHFVFAAKDVAQRAVLKEPEKCEGWEWVDLNDLRENTLPGHFAAIQMFKEKKHFVILHDEMRCSLNRSLLE